MASNRSTRRSKCITWGGVAVGLAVLLVCCKSDQSSESNEASSPEPALVAAPVADGPPAAVVTPLSCSVTLEGSHASLTVVSLHKKEIAGFVGWVYLYREGKHVGRVRAPGTKPLRAGETTTSLRTLVPDVQADQVECEIGEVTFAGGAMWRNDNVVYASADSRPLGGAPAIAAVPVVVEWTGSVKDPGHFNLANKSARSLLVARAGVFFLDSTGAVIKRSIANVQTELTGKASVALGLGVKAKRLPEGTTSIRVFVSEASFLDGDKEKWRDLNRERSLPYAEK